MTLHNLSPKAAPKPQDLRPGSLAAKDMFPTGISLPRSGQDLQVPFTGRPSSPDVRSTPPTRTLLQILPPSPSPFLLRFVSWHFVVEPISHIWLFVIPWPAAHQASLSFTISQSLLKLMSIESVMPSSHLTLCRPLLLLPSIFPSIRVFPSESWHLSLSTLFYMVFIFLFFWSASPTGISEGKELKLFGVITRSPVSRLMSFQHTEGI